MVLFSEAESKNGVVFPRHQGPQGWLECPQNSCKLDRISPQLLKGRAQKLVMLSSLLV